LSYRDIIEYLDRLRIFWANQEEKIVLKIQTARTTKEGVKILRRYIQAEPRYGKLDSTPEDILRTQLRMIINNLTDLKCGDLPEMPAPVLFLMLEGRRPRT
jgi:serine/threonine-protein kinase RIO1